MSGFIGIFKNKTQLTERENDDVRQMTKQIAHRGPGKEDFWFALRGGMGFRGPFEEESKAKKGLFVSLDGRYAALCDGEINNGEKLREDLINAGETFETSLETEVIVKLYSLHGPSFIHRLAGTFAFLIYDCEKHAVMAGRDPFGAKPLYYRESEDGGKVAFASEMKAFLGDTSYNGFKVDPTLLQHYMTFQYVTEPDTITGDIQILPAGHYMVWGESCDTRCYYKPLFTPKLKAALKYDEKKKALRLAVEESVRRNLNTDAPIGAFLSSGVDSAVITALASAQKPGIKAFTVGFDVEGFSELDDAAAMAARLHVEHIPVKCGLSDFVDNFEKAIYHLDSPVADPSVVAIYLVCKEASKHVRTVLAGEGSDELFGGYRVYATSRFASALGFVPDFLKRLIVSLVKALPDGVKGKNFLYRAFAPVEDRYVGNSFVFLEKEKKELLKTFDPAVRYAQRTKDIYAEAAGSSPLVKMQHCDMRTWLRSDILVKGDRLAMAHALETRVPFLDKEVFQAAAALNDRDKIQKGTTKYIFRDTFSDIVGKDTALRPKLGYPVPVKAWLKDELYDWAADIIKQNAAEDYIVTSEALKLLESHRMGKLGGEGYHKIWVILTFLTWYRLYVENGYKDLWESR